MGDITAGAASQNGAIGYVYDAVGNRQSLTSTVPAIPAGTLFYDSNDRLSTDVYDNDGNTISSGSIGNVYDFENHLVQHGLVTIVYDGDGNRVSKTAGGVTTTYLVDTNSVTGYAQVLEELQSGAVKRKYTFGLALISENQLIGSTQTVSFYGFDGHGSVRQITDRNGAVTDAYTYDAFGNILTATGSTPNNYKFAGEQFDPDLGLYYNRARYLDVRQGRFWGMDFADTDEFDPKTIHRYVFASDAPIDTIDPSGAIPIVDRIRAGLKVHTRIGDNFVASGPGRLSNRAIRTILAKFFDIDKFDYTRPDLTDTVTKEVYEIKSIGTAAEGIVQLQGYIDSLNAASPGTNWHVGTSYLPPTPLLNVYKTFHANVNKPVAGIITYSLYEDQDNDKENLDDDDIDPGSVGLAIISAYIAYPLILACIGAATNAELGLGVGTATATTAIAGVD